MQNMHKNVLETVNLLVVTLKIHTMGQNLKRNKFFFTCILGSFFPILPLLLSFLPLCKLEWIAAPSVCDFEKLLNSRKTSQPPK